MKEDWNKITEPEKGQAKSSSLDPKDIITETDSFSTGVRMTHTPTAIAQTCYAHHSRIMNRKECLARLTEAVLTSYSQ